MKKFHRAVSLLLALSMASILCFMRWFPVKAKDSAKMSSYIDSDTSLTVYLAENITLTGKNSDGFLVYDSQAHAVKIESVVDSATGKSNISTKLVKINVSTALDITDKYTVKRDGFESSDAVARKVLDEDKYYYSGDDLGSVYSSDATSFRIWAPTAREVSLLLFDTADSSVPSNTYTMNKSENGTWKTTVGGDLNRKYYQYRIILYVNGNLTTYNVDDPYSYGSSANSGKSLIYDSKQTDPLGWESDKYVTLKNSVDAIIYELHIRDYTISDSSGVKQKYKGKYLGMTQSGTKSPEGESTGLDNIKDLGITHVELMPTYDYGTGDETESNEGYSWYNWGYDPVLWNNVEGSYATSPYGSVRQSEYKKMVKAFHDNGIGVIADAVYNHTYQTGNSMFSIFDKIVPGYYYRISDDGTYSNGSGCGNDIASEKPMVRKFIIDSVKYWVKEYHIDGMRFDLMGLIDKETMEEVLKAAKAINPNFIAYGEAWNMSTALDSSKRLIQKNIPNSGFAAFNDGIRDKTNKFAENLSMPELTDYIGYIKGALMGNGVKLTTPNETINYASCHDDLNLWDLISSRTDVSNSDRLKMDALTNTIILTSQGIPFFSEGDEFGRSKNGNANSYNDNNSNVNPINWALKSQNKKLYNYYKGIIALRKAHPAFRMTDAAMIDKNIMFDTSGEGSQFVGYVIKNNANGDSWKNIYVAFNGGSKSIKATINGKWTIVANGEYAGTSSLGTADGEITIPAYSSVIMYNNDLDSIKMSTDSSQADDNEKNGEKVSNKAVTKVNNPSTGEGSIQGVLLSLIIAAAVVLCAKKNQQ